MPTARPVRCDLDELLDEAPVKNSAIVWPTSIDRHLTHLADVASGGHRRVARRVLLAAIVLGCEPNADVISRALGRFYAAYAAAASASGKRQKTPAGGRSAILTDTRPRAAGIVWPLPVDRRLDQLIILLDEARHEPAYRKDLAAALVLSCKAGRPHLLGLIRHYERSDVRSALLGTPAEDRHLDIPHYGPGRRSPAKQAREARRASTV